jgi:diguanylate cyclase (GGDEF)-like protein/PAS domain S-box-containing protein
MVTKPDRGDARHQLQAQVKQLTRAVTRLRHKLELNRRAVAAMAASETRLRAIFEGASIGLAQITPSGHFLEVNQSFRKIVGYDREELLNRTYLDVVHPEDRDANLGIRKQLLDGHMPSVRLENRYVRKDGEAVWVNLNVAAGMCGEQACLLVAAENISERRTLQESLGRIASNLARAERMALSGSWQWNSRNGTVRASEEVFHLFELAPTKRAVPIERFLERIHAEDRPLVDSALASILSENRPYQIECRIVLHDGAQKVVYASGEVYSRDEEGRPRSILGVVQDVSLRRKVEMALKESEQRFRELFDNASDGIVIARRDGTCIDVNRSICTLLGHTRDELIGKRIVDLIPENDLQRLEDTRTYLLRDLAHVQLTNWELKHKSGAYVPVEVSTRILPDGRWMAIVRDITERRQTQQALERYTDEIRDLYDNAPCGYHSLDGNAVFVQINQTELDWLGYTREELIGTRKVTELLTERSQDSFRKHFPDFLRSARVQDLEFEFVRKDGSILPVLLSATAEFDSQGNVVSSRTTLFDISEMQVARARLRQAAAVFEHTNEAILITDANSVIVAVNKAFTRITGYSPEEVIGKSPRMLKSGRQDDTFYRNLWAAIEEHGFWQGEIWDRKRSGEIFPAWESITDVKDESGKVTEHIAIFSDITTIKETEANLMKLAYEDTLTGLPNRLLYNDRLAQALAHARRHDTRAALLMLDLDRFKLVNDTLGHSAGDELLQAVATRLRTAVRAEDTVARLGGDEFAIILPHLADPSDAALLAEKIVQLVSVPLQIAGHGLTMSTSVGIGIFPDDADDAETLAKVADTAMYGAKSKGRNAYEFYRREMTTAAAELLAIDRGLRVALDANELSVVYQPKIDLGTGRITGLEALLRWDSPAFGMLSPARFIPVAEETSMIDRIGEWVLDVVCAQIQQWKSRNVTPVRIAVNVSARQFKRPGFVVTVCEKLAACAPLDGFGIDLEITETELQTEETISDALRSLKTYGMTIAVDDFGTGFSSLNSLKHLPVDVLKIDRSFVKDLPADPDSSAIASAIIAMGHSLGLSIIAEGVETQEQLKFVYDLGCDEVQGFLFFAPLSAAECEQLLLEASVSSMIFPAYREVRERRQF